MCTMQHDTLEELTILQPSLTYRYRNNLMLLINVFPTTIIINNNYLLFFTSKVGVEYLGVVVEQIKHFILFFSAKDRCQTQRDA